MATSANDTKAQENESEQQPTTVQKPPFSKADILSVNSTIHVKYSTHGDPSINMVLRALPPLQQALIEDNMEADPNWGKRPMPPTYEMVLGGGATEKRFHTEDSIKVDGTDEEKAEWAAYKDRAAAWATEFVNRQFEMMMLDGIIIDVPPLSTWQKQAQRRGIRYFPDDPEDLKILYIKFAVMRDPRDADKIGKIVGYLNKLQQKGVSELADSLFRNQVEGDATK